MDPWIGQSVRWGLCQEPFVSGEVAQYIIVEDFVEGCHVWGLPSGSVHRAYVYWCGKHTCCVGWVFPCRVYIDSNRHDSRI
jgi:hypothetical protein